MLTKKNKLTKEKLKWIIRAFAKTLAVKFKVATIAGLVLKPTRRNVKNVR